VEALLVLFSPDLMALMIIGLFIGIFAGALPGLQGGSAIALCLPFTLTMTALQALIFLMSIFAGAGFGGGVTAVLIGIPGSPAAIATVFDGFQMAKRGLQARALGIALGASSAGSLLGSILLLIFLFPLSRIALTFGPVELVLTISMGLLVIALVHGKSVPKGLLAGAFGIVLGTVGIAPSGASRAMFDIPYLLDGFPFNAALVGLFAVPSLINMVQIEFVAQGPRQVLAVREILRGLAVPLRYPIAFLRSALIGVGIGLIPAAGAAVACVVSYNVGRVISRRGARFGTGEEEGVVCAESADSSSEGGSAATMFALGIPGGSATAVLLGAVILQGWVPGPRMVFDHLDVINSVLWGNVLQSLLLVPSGVVFSYFAEKTLRLKTRTLVPLLFAIIVFGVYAIRGQIADVWVMIGFGLMAFLLERRHYPLINVVLGLLLGPLFEAEVIRAVTLYSGRWERVFERPTAIGLMILLVILVALPRLLQWLKSTRRRAAI
jgi:putative tricarboxylic transport membrane protein